MLFLLINKPTQSIYVPRYFMTVYVYLKLGNNLTHFHNQNILEKLNFVDWCNWSLFGRYSRWCTVVLMTVNSDWRVCLNESRHWEINIDSNRTSRNLKYCGKYGIHSLWSFSTSTVIMNIRYTCGIEDYRLEIWCFPNLYLPCNHNIDLWRKIPNWVLLSTVYSICEHRGLLLYIQLLKNILSELSTVVAPQVRGYCFKLIGNFTVLWMIVFLKRG